MDGYIKLHRKLLESEVFQNEKLLKVFIYCLLKASHKEHELKIGRQTVKVQKGQFVFGRKKASLELGIPESTVRDYMKILKKDKMIDIKSTNKYSVVSIVNWGVYQSSGEKDDIKSDSKRTADGQQMDTYKNGNNKKNNNKANLNPFMFFEQEGFGQISSFIADKLNFLIDDYGEEKVLEAMKNSVSRNIRNLNYVEKVLRNPISKGGSVVQYPKRKSKAQETEDNIMAFFDNYKGG